MEIDGVIIGFKQDFIHRIETTKDICSLPVIHIDGPKGLQFVNVFSVDMEAGEIMEDLVAGIGMIGNRRHGRGCNDDYIDIRINFLGSLLYLLVCPLTEEHSDSAREPP